MTIKGHGNSEPVVRPRIGQRPAQDSLVPKMQPVEYPNRHTYRLRPRLDLVRPTDDSHAGRSVRRTDRNRKKKSVHPLSVKRWITTAHNATVTAAPMTSRERIQKAICHEPVDRVPVDLGGTRQSGMAALAYSRLRKQLRPEDKSPFKILDLFQMLAEIEPAIAAHFGTDTVALNRSAVAFGIPNRDWKPFRLSDGTEVLVPGGFNPAREANGDLVILRDGQPIGRMPNDGFYFDRLEKYPGALHPNLEQWDPPRLSAADLEHYKRESLRLHEETDLAIIAALGPPFELFNGLGQGGFEEWMITFASEPDYVNALYRKLTDAWLDNLVAFHRAVGDRIQILQICDDFGTQRAPFLSVPMFRDRVMPAYRRGLDWIHANTPWKVMLHSDGALFPLLDSIIEMGVDILNPVQTSAVGMQPSRLKHVFGDRLVFWGGTCDPQTTLKSGTPEEVAAETLANVRVFAPGSGYVFAPIHNIQADVPPQNVVALFDCLKMHHSNSSDFLP
jgi:uroporphyrinogen decarboxylase